MPDSPRRGGAEGDFEMILYMYKVTTIVKGESKISLFQEKREAELFKHYMEAKGLTVSLNKWTWKTEIEE